MQYNVAQLLQESTGSTRNYQLMEEFTGPQRFANNVRGPVHFLRTHQGILVTASVEVGSTSICARCLGDFDGASELEIEEEFFPTVDLQSGRSLSAPEDIEEMSVIDQNHMLDLNSIFAECFVSAMPMKPLCSFDCKGLCQMCGTNKNLKKCDCDGLQGDPRWEALRGLTQSQEV